MWCLHPELWFHAVVFTDIDECALNTHNCGPGYDCHNIQGSFRCVTKRCPQGYRLNVVTGECEVVVCTRGMRADGAGNCVGVYFVTVL